MDRVPGDEWLGWIARELNGREYFRWWEIPDLAPPAQVRATRRVIECAVAAAVVTFSWWLTGVKGLHFSVWSIGYTVLTFVAACSYLRVLIENSAASMRRGPRPLSPTLPHALALRWPRRTAPVVDLPAAGSYRADRRACVVMALAWAPAGALPGALLSGWGAAAAWPWIVAAHVAGAAVIAGLRSGAWSQLKIAELALWAWTGNRVRFLRLLEDATRRRVLRHGTHGYEFRDPDERARLASLGQDLPGARARERATAHSPDRKGILPTVAWLSTDDGARLLLDFAGGGYLFGIVVFAALAPGAAPLWLGMGILGFLVFGPLAALLVFLAASRGLTVAVVSARTVVAASLPPLARGGRIALGIVATALAVAIGALLVATEGTFLARALAFTLPALFVAGCGIWTAVVPLRRWLDPDPDYLWALLARDAIVVVTTGAALLVLVDHELLTSQSAAVLLFPVAVTASIQAWTRMRHSSRLSVRAAADITLSLLLGGELVLFLVWLANVLGMSRSELARLRSALERAGSTADVFLDWRVWVAGYLVLALAIVATVVWPARLRPAARWLDRLKAASVMASAQRVLTGLKVGLLSVVLIAAAAPPAVAVPLQRQLRVAYMVALQRQFEADGAAAAYAEVIRAFTPHPRTPPVILADIVREVHDKAVPAPGRPADTRAEADLAGRLGRLQAISLMLPRPPAREQAAGVQADAAGFDEPVHNAADLRNRTATTAAEESKSDADGKRLELAAELAAKAVATAITAYLPNISWNEVVQVIAEYLNSLIEDSPLKGVFTAWLERLPHVGQPPGAEAMVIPVPSSLAEAADSQMIKEAATDFVVPPTTSLLRNGTSDAAFIKTAVGLTAQTAQIHAGRSCAGCIRLRDPRVEIPKDEHPVEP